MIDKAEFPRDKPCGEGLLPHGIEQLAALGVDDVLDVCGAQSFRGILYRAGGVVAAGDFENGMRGRGVRRHALDDALRARATQLGAQLSQGVVTKAAVDDVGRVACVTLSDGAELRAGFLVGADGPRSVVRHTLGLDGGVPQRPRYALRQHFELAPGVPLPDRVEVTALKDHELYMTPVGPGVVGVAALCEKAAMDAGSGPPEARLRALIDACAPLRDRLDRSTPASRALACGPLRVKANDVSTKNAVLVGDAAGYVDAITGEGMSLALKTARFAAQAIVDVTRGQTHRQAFARYKQRRANAFRDHAILTFGLVELARRPALVRRAIARLAKEPALFSRLLSVNNGTKRFFDLSPLDLLKLVVGSTPTRVMPTAMTAATSTTRSLHAGATDETATARPG